MKEIKVIELFAGVGGFHLGLRQASNRFKVVWSNQWEPGSKSQDASKIYVKQFGEQGHSNQDISTVPTTDIPGHNLLVGGFPCQDYSVARTLNQASGLEGKKGVLWWEIYRILNEKKNKPEFLFLENVDRLLKSPAKQRGRDFAIMLASLSDLGYAVEWRVINAADYGMPQRRRRVFFLGYLKGTNIFKNIREQKDPFSWILEKGLFAEAFNVQPKNAGKSVHFSLEGELPVLSESFNTGPAKLSPFRNAGLMIGRQVFTIETSPVYNGPFETLGDKILLNGAVPEEYYIPDDRLDKWLYLKGAKNEKRMNRTNGYEYRYSEGAMVFPDPLDKPSRTIVTGEGGASPSRFKHVVRQPADGRYRRLTPLELERLNMFPDNHTAGASDIKRAFIMGNALVVGIVEQVGRTLIKRIV